MAIGEVGSLTRGGFGDGEIVRIDFTDPLTDPVIHLSSTNAGGNEFSLRVILVDANGFNFILEEWEDEDGPHPATETINWIAVEEGTHTLPDGRVIEAGITTATTTASSVTLDPAHTGTPVVLTNVMSNNETDVVDSDPFNVTSTGFDVQLQEGSLVDGVHAAETVGFIAISTGGDGTAGYASIFDQTTDPLETSNNTFDLGGSLTDGAVFGETQTMNGQDAGNVVIGSGASISGSTGNVVAKFDEETGDGESSHNDETLGLVGFELGAIPCFCPGDVIATPMGERRVETLETGCRVLTHDHGIQTVLAALSVTVDVTTSLDLAPIIIRKNAIAPNVPHTDLRVSPQHRMLVQGWRAELAFGETEVLVPAKALINDHSIVRDTAATSATYVHLAFEDHEILFSNGAASESLHAGYISKEKMNPAGREELFRLFPDLRTMPHAWQRTARKALSVREGRLLA